MADIFFKAERLMPDRADRDAIYGIIWRRRCNISIIFSRENCFRIAFGDFVYDM